jgi:hypothetical protein
MATRLRTPTRCPRPTPHMDYGYHNPVVSESHGLQSRLRWLPSLQISQRLRRGPRYGVQLRLLKSCANSPSPSPCSPYLRTKDEELLYMASSDIRSIIATTKKGRRLADEK